MADYKHPRKRKSPSLKLSTDSIPPQLPVYSAPPQTDPGWNRFDPFVDKPPDYPESSEEADADESDQEAPVIHRRRLPSPQIYVSPFQSSPRKTRRVPHQFHSPSPSLTSHRTRHHPRSSGLHHAASNSDSYLDSLLARSVHALEISNTLLRSSLATKSSMASVLSTDSHMDESLEESATGLSKRVMKSKDLQKHWIDDLEEIGKRVDSLFGEQTETEGGPGPSNGLGLQIPVKPPSWDAASPVSQSLPISSGLPQTLAERRRGRNSPLLAVVTPTSEGRLGYSTHDRSHFVAPPPRALTVYIGSDDTDPDAIKLPPTLGVKSPAQPAHPHPFQSATSSTASSPVLSRRTSFSNGQSVQVRTPELSSTAPLRAYDILSSYVSPQRGPNKVTRSQSFGSNTSPPMPVNTRWTQANPTRSEIPNISTSPSTSRGRSLTPLRIHLDPQSNSPLFLSTPLTPPIEELPSGNSSSESDTQTNFAVTSLRKIFMDDQALAIEREKQLSVSRSLSNTGSRMRPPPQLLAPPKLPEASTSHATASIERLLTKNKHSSSTRPPSPPRQSSLRSPSVRSAPLSPAPSPSPSLLSIPHIFGSGSGGSNNGSGRSTPNRVSFAALPESYANSKPGGPDEQFKERRRKRRKSGGRSPLNTHSRSRSLEDVSDGGNGWGWWGNWLLAGNNVGNMTLRIDQEARIEERVARWGARPSPL